MFQGPLETTPTADGHLPFFYASRFVEFLHDAVYVSFFVIYAGFHGLVNTFF
jgi:hypothetical protein